MCMLFSDKSNTVYIGCFTFNLPHVLLKQQDCCGFETHILVIPVKHFGIKDK